MIEQAIKRIVAEELAAAIRRGLAPTTHEILSSSLDQTWQTPERILDLVRECFSDHTIHLDPATVASNPTGARRFFTPKEDGLAKSWRAKTVYLNPPYAKALPRWVSKAVQERRNYRELITLTPARVGSRWFQELHASADGIAFLRGRPKFRGAMNASPFPVAMSYTGPRLRVFRAIMEHEGFAQVWLL